MKKIALFVAAFLAAFAVVSIVTVLIAGWP
jgi:hypothetical protein